MAVVVGYVPTETGFRAVTEAVREARTFQVPVVIVNVVGLSGFTTPTAAEDQDLDSLTARLTSDGVEHSVQQIESGESVADLLLSVADSYPLILLSAALVGIGFLAVGAVVGVIIWLMLDDTKLEDTELDELPGASELRDVLGNLSKGINDLGD